MGMLQLPDYRFIRGHEWDGNVALYLDVPTDESICVWVGYLYDILRNADKNSDNWTGFTKDCLLEVRTMNPQLPWVCIEDMDEYIADWKHYADAAFELPETRECYNLILAFLEDAKNNGHSVWVTYHQTLSWKPVGDTGLPVLPDWRFYRGSEGEGELELDLDGNENESIHIWEGYLNDVLHDPDLSGNGWTGFMRDWQQGERTLDPYRQNVPIEDIDEYIEDWKQHAGEVADMPGSKECYKLILAFLEYAKSTGRTIYATYW